MHISLRRLIFAIFVTVFLVSAPLLVLHTAGYRLNISNRHLLQTGVLALATAPRGSTITLNGQSLAQKTPYVVQRIMPSTHTLVLQRKGYHDWSQRVSISEGKTTYVTARLFAESEPVLLDDTEAALALRSRTDFTTTPDQASISLFDNGANLEVRSGTATEGTLIGLLPRGTYELIVESPEYIVLTNDRQTPFVIARNGGAVVELPTTLTAFDWLENKDLFLWTDGNEVNIYDAANSIKTFITRQSEAVVDVAWHPEADSLFVASADSLAAYDMSVHETREVTPLLTNLPMGDIWIDSAGKNLYFTKQPVSDTAPDQIFALPLVL